MAVEPAGAYAHDAGRPGSFAPDPAQPAAQCSKIYIEWNDHAWRGSRTASPAPVGKGHRVGHPGRTPGAHLRTVRERGPFGPPAGGDWVGIKYYPPSGGAAQRLDDVGEP